MKTLRRIIPLLSALAAAAIVMLYEDGASEHSLSAARLCCDGLFIAGILHLCAGGLVFVSTCGGFDSLRYAAKRLVARFSRRDDGLSYRDYVLQRLEKAHSPYAAILAAGALCVGVAAIFLPFC